MFRKIKFKLSKQRTFEMLITGYIQALTLAQDSKYAEELTISKSLIRGAALILGYREPVINEVQVCVYDKKGNVLMNMSV